MKIGKELTLGRLPNETEHPVTCADSPLSLMGETSAFPALLHVRPRLPPGIMEK